MSKRPPAHLPTQATPLAARPRTAPRRIAIGVAATATFALGVWGLAMRASSPTVVPVPPASPLAGSAAAADRPAQLTLDPQPAVADQPAEQGWPSEVLANQAKHTLEALCATSTQRGTEVGVGADPQTAVAALVTPDAKVADLRPNNLVPVVDDRRLRVWRQPQAVQRTFPQQPTVAALDTIQPGPAAVARAFASLAAPWRAGPPPQVQWKVVAVQQKADTIAVSAYYEAWGPTASGAAEQHALGHFEFRQHGDHLRLATAELHDFEETVRQGQAPLLAEVTHAVVGHTAGYANEMLVGTNAWLLRTEKAAGADVIGHQGLTVGDVDGNGLDDLYVLQPAGVPNRLYLQQADGTVLERSAWAGVDWLDRTRSALLIDLDNDGDQDLVATVAWADTATTRALVVAENDGSGRFSQRGRFLVGADLYGLAAADFDGDGDLDLYACQFNPGEVTAAGFGAPLPYHDANNGGRNTLLRNDGGWRFADVTQAVGLDENNRRWSYAATWEDFDGDGDVDLHVANDHGRDNLYLNQGGMFHDVAAAAAVDDVSAGMSSSWADYDRDGDFDLYVGNMFSSAGRRIASQTHFQPAADTAVRGHYQRHAQGNSLFRNRGDRHFDDVSVASGTTLGRWAWASVFTDVDNDGWQDLLVANGMFTGDDPTDL